MKVCEAPGCEEEFEPASWNQKYHSQECKRDVENINRRRALAADIAAAIAPTYGLDVEDSAQIKLLRDNNVKLARENDKLKTSKKELIDAIYQATFDAVAQLDNAPVPAPAKDRRKGDEEVAVAVVSDLQLAKITPTYNSDICEERMALYADKIIKLTEIQRADHPVRHLRVWLLGDIVEGELIFPGQAHLIDNSLYNQVAVSGPRILKRFFQKMLSYFETVHVVAVIGNHGRIGGRASRDHEPETNADRMLYRIMAHIFEDEPRISFDIPDGHGERNWYAVDTIGNYGTLLMHGDQFTSISSTYSFAKKVLGWKSGAIPEKFDDVFCGHWHQNTTLTLNNTLLRINGSTESYNTYAQEALAAMGRPSQRLQYVHPEHGVTCEYLVWLDEV